MRQGSFDKTIHQSDAARRLVSVSLHRKTHHDWEPSWTRWFIRICLVGRFPRHSRYPWFGLVAGASPNYDPCIYFQIASRSKVEHILIKPKNISTYLKIQAIEVLRRCAGIGNTNPGDWKPLFWPLEIGLTVTTVAYNCDLYRSISHHRFQPDTRHEPEQLPCIKGLLSLAKGDILSILYSSSHKAQAIEYRPTPQVTTRSTVDMSKAPITFIQWICTIPGGKMNAIESLCSSCCKTSGFNSVVVR